ncbi:hypothetical protein SLH47_17390 [Cognatiyoonia sp. IB215182]|nr:hypothetical protein [Cognatiyoonia sp. IB215182]
MAYVLSYVHRFLGVIFRHRASWRINCRAQDVPSSHPRAFGALRGGF